MHPSFDKCPSLCRLWAHGLPEGRGLLIKNLRLWVNREYGAVYRVGKSTTFMNDRIVFYYNYSDKEVTFWRFTFISGRAFRCLGKVKLEDRIDELPEDLQDLIAFNLDIFS